MIPVIDPRARFGLPPTAETVHTRILVLELEMDGEPLVVGGQPDSVREVIELEACDIGPAPRIASRWQSELVKGMARRDDECVIGLDVGRILDLEGLTATAEAAA